MTASLALQHRWLATALGFVVYVAAFLVLYPMAGAPVASLSFFPVVIGAYLYGRSGGYLLVLVTSAANAGLFASVEGASEEASGLAMAVVPVLALLVTAEVMARLRSSRIRLVDLVDSKDRFLASVSHELRTPLTGVVGFSEILSQSWGELPEAERQLLIEEIETQAREVSAIIDDLLVASRAELDQLSVLDQPVDVPAEIHTVLRGLNEPGKERIVQDASDGTLVASGDAARLRQIVRNLASNALRYGGPVVRIATVPEEDSVLIRVADSGDPLPDKEWERIFQPYHRAHRADENPSGVGIGLSVSRTLARLMGGDLIYYHRGGMSVFEVRLRAAAESHSTTPVSSRVG